MPTYPVSTDLAPERAWFKSSYSDSGGQNCIEATPLSPHLAIRDSKNTDGPALLVPSHAWAAFIAHVTAG
jgi:hypothetical protein